VLDSIRRIWTVIYRNMIWAYRSPFRLTDVLLWPLFMLFMFTFFLSTTGGNESLLGIIVVSVICWRAIFFVAFETTTMFVEEHWDQSLPDLLVSPISTFEISLGGALTGMIKAVLVALLVLAVAGMVYGFILTDILKFSVALVVMMVAGLCVGLVLFGLASYFEKRNVFTLSFIIPEMLGLVSGPYFNVDDVFPQPVASLLQLFPSTHAFNLLKSMFGMAEADIVMMVLTTLLWLLGAFLVNRFFVRLGRKSGRMVKVG
jgi:ABC-type multidrug transport system permease subunit